MLRITFYKVPSMLTFINFYSAPVNPRVLKFGVFMRIALTPFLIVMLIFIVFQADFNYKLWFVNSYCSRTFSLLVNDCRNLPISLSISKYQLLISKVQCQLIYVICMKYRAPPRLRLQECSCSIITSYYMNLNFFSYIFTISGAV